MLINKTPFLVIVYLVNTCIASGKDDIDEDHYEMFPYCGSMSEEGSQTKSRAINAEDARENYRWVALLKRENTERSGTIDVKFCVGTIISDR